MQRTSSNRLQWNQSERNLGNERYKQQHKTIMIKLCDCRTYFVFLSVLDSSAKFETGFIFGNNFLFGSLKECEALKESHLVTLSKRFFRNMKTNLVDSVAPFDLEYNVVYAKHDSPWQIQSEFLLTRVCT